MSLLSILPPAEADAARDEMRALLARYPDLDDAGRHRLAALFGTARLLDVGLMSSDPALTAKYQAFRIAEARRLRPSAGEMLRFLAFYLVPGGLIAWAVAQVA
jgi:hypothetical protein